ncbi:MAG: hypothetical protein FJ271_10905 [Planctomycetes bacterium]|nr:hypothetical protein [Planctomycetota bacterium]
MKFLAGGLIAVVGMVFCLGASGAGDKKPKYDIKEVMDKAHKTGLWKKVAAGTADEDERKELSELYTALSQNKPPKGELSDWKKVTGALAKAAKAAVKDAAKGKALKKLVNCGGCHKEFK